MKKDEKNKLRGKDKNALTTEISVLRQELSKLPVHESQAGDKKVHSIGLKRKRLAVLLTMLREKDINN